MGRTSCSFWYDSDAIICLNSFLPMRHSELSLRAMTVAPLGTLYSSASSPTTSPVVHSFTCAVTDIDTDSYARKPQMYRSIASLLNGCNRIRRAATGRWVTATPHTRTRTFTPSTSTSSMPLETTKK